jgi:hypothetical protein
MRDGRQKFNFETTDFFCLLPQGHFLKQQCFSFNLDPLSMYNCPISLPIASSILRNTGSFRDRKPEKNTMTPKRSLPTGSVHRSRCECPQQTRNFARGNVSFSRKVDLPDGVKFRVPTLPAHQLLWQIVGHEFHHIKRPSTGEEPNDSRWEQTIDSPASSRTHNRR